MVCEMSNKTVQARPHVSSKQQESKVSITQFIPTNKSVDESEKLHIIVAHVEVKNGNEIQT